MTTPTPSVPDAIGLGVFLAGLIYSPEVAAVLGPYVVIILASVIGASFAVRRRDKTSRIASVIYFLRVAGLAVLGTVVIAQAIGDRYEGWTARALITPVALLIGAVGDDWPGLFRALARYVFTTVVFFRPERGRPMNWDLARLMALLTWPACIQSGIGTRMVRVLIISD